MASDRKSNRAVTIRAQPTTRRPLPKRASTESLKNIPTMKTGIIEIRISRIWMMTAEITASVNPCRTCGVKSI